MGTIGKHADWEPLVTSAASVAPDKVATIDPFDDRWSRNSLLQTLQASDSRGGGGCGGPCLKYT